MKVFHAKTVGHVMHLMKRMTTAATAPKSTLGNIVKVSNIFTLYQQDLDIKRGPLIG